MPVTYTKCDEDVMGVVRKMTDKYHPDLKEAGAKVACLFAHAEKNENGEATGPAVTVGGYACAAKIKIIGLKERCDGRADAEIVIDADQWDESTDDRRFALIDHELHHLHIKRNRDSGTIQRDDLDRPKMKLRKHDHQFGWFDIVAQRHGEASYEVSQAKCFVDTRGQMYFGWEAPPKQASEPMKIRKAQ